MAGFNPANERSCRDVGVNLDKFLDMMESIVYFGPDVDKKYRKKFLEGMAEARKLANKLKKGKTKGIFKDEDEWNLIG